jgi:RNA polymerase sigma-70 factor (ECF subfamily)
LADQLRRGDLVALEVIIEIYQQPIISYASRFLGDPTEAHDVAQNVFVQVFKQADRFRFQSKVSTWLYAIARNICRNEYRRRVRQRAELLDLVEPDPRSTGRLKSQDLRCSNIPEAAVLDAELQQKIEESVASMPRKQRTAILLLLKQDLSYEEVARILRTSVPAHQRPDSSCTPKAQGITSTVFADWCLVLNCLEGQKSCSILQAGISIMQHVFRVGADG